MMRLVSLPVLFLPALSYQNPTLNYGEPKCEILTFTYTINTTIRNVSPAPDLSAPDAVSAYLPALLREYNTAPNTTREGTYTLAGHYCAAHGDRPLALQILAHGSSYTKEYWDRSAWGTLPLPNSYQRFAASQGYSTLAIDRLCNGASSRPDPPLDCQLITSIEVFHALISALKKGTASDKIPISVKLSFVGHSAGSITVSNFVQQYPNDVDTAILTGWPSGPLAGILAKTYYARHNITPPAPPQLYPAYFPASQGDPARFANLDQGYIISTNATLRNVFYGGSYNPSYPHLDFLSRGASPLGEASYTGLTSFPAFTGRVVVATGDLDGSVWADGDVIADSRATFPRASHFDWIRAKSSGHDINYHRSAPDTYRNIFQTLDRQASTS